MDNRNQVELFGLKLNSEGIAHLQRFARMIRVYLVIGIVFIIFSLFNEVTALITFRRFPGDSILDLYFMIYPLLILIGIVIFIFQLIYFKRLSVLMQKAVNDSDERTFNAAFENLTKIAWVVICNAVIAIIYSVLNLAISLRAVF
jgi:hypothetical protein